MPTRLSTQLLATRKEAPGDARTVSQALLVRAGQLHQAGPGMVSVGPLLRRALRRIEALVRAELDGLGAQEVGLSGPGSSVQEAAAFAAGRLTSHRQLPQVLYEVAVRVRDAPAAGAGLLGARDTVRSDAYAFALDAAGADAVGQRLAEALGRVSARCGVQVIAADAESGPDGGVAVELVAPAEGGEAVVAASEAGGYAATTTVARASLTPPAGADADAAMIGVPTPGATTMAALQPFVPDVPPERMVKTLLYRTLDAHGDGGLVVALCRGDRQLDERKLARAVGASEVGMAAGAAVEELTGAGVGYAGPVGLAGGVRVIADHAVADVDGFVCGANRTGMHLRDVRWGRDVDLPETADIDQVQDGDPAPDGGVLRLRRGVVVGGVRGLGTGWSAAAGLRAAGPDGGDAPLWMTHARVDVTRLAAVAVEQHHDEAGIVWPTAIAPHPVVVVAVRADDDEQRRLAERVCAELESGGVDVCLDDRDQRAGVKFADAELLGFPWRLTCGRDAADGRVEASERASGDTETVEAVAAVRRVVEAVRAARVPAL